MKKLLTGLVLLSTPFLQLDAQLRTVPEHLTPSRCQAEVQQPKATLGKVYETLKAQGQDAEAWLSGVQNKPVVRQAQPVINENAPRLQARVISAKASEELPEGYSRIILLNDAAWDDGSGYQVLLDADCEIYNSSNFDDQGYGWIGKDYSPFEYKLPENAIKSQDPKYSIVAPNGGELDFPAGAYDWVILNPSWGIYYIAGGSALYDDYVFQAGIEYEVYVYMSGGYDAVSITPLAPYDLGLTNIAVAGSLPYTAAENITVELTNTGESSWTEPVNLKLNFNGTTVATETVTFAEALRVGKTTTYTFTTTVDLSTPGDYSIDVVLESSKDLINVNNAIAMETSQPGPLEAPVFYDFQEGENYVVEDEWIILDGDLDGRSWFFDDNWMGSYYMSYDAGRLSSDYMVTFNPIKLKAGTNSVTLDYRSNLSNDFEATKFEVLIGKAPTIEGLTTRVGTIDNITTDIWTTCAITFDLEEDGEYYVGFHAYADIDDYTKGVRIDNIKIETGFFFGNPDAYIEDLLPAPSPLLSDKETVKARIYNLGTTDIKAFTLSYTVDDQAPVVENFELATPIEPTQYADVAFVQTADFSAIKEYIVAIEVSNVVSSNNRYEENQQLVNNQVVTPVYKMRTAETPFITNFSEGLQPLNWVSEDNSWYFNQASYGFNGGNNTPIYSCGVMLEEGKEYMFTMSYRGGMSYMVDIPTVFGIYYGEAGTDLYSWELIAAKTDAITLNGYETESFKFTAKKSGNFQFAVAPDYEYGNAFLFIISSITVEENADYDVRTITLKAPTVLPISQAKTFDVTVGYENHGTKSTNLDYELFIDSKSVGKETVKNVAAKSTGEIYFTGQIENPVVGQQSTITATPTVPGQDYFVSTSMTKPLTISESTLAYDATTDDKFDPGLAIGVPNGSAALGIGSVFTITEQDLLTGVTIGWAGETAVEIPFMFYEYDLDYEELGDLLFEATFEKDEKLGWRTYNVIPRMLPEGSYAAIAMISGYNLATDGAVDGKLIVHQPTGNSFGFETNYGNAAIRLEFGEGQEVMNDLGVKAITKPSESGVFTANQPVVAVIENIGSATTKGVATLNIDGKDIATKDVEVGGYAKKNVEFTADLSALGRHTITISVKGEGDTNAANDKLSKVVISSEVSVNYSLNFENCEDFSHEFIPSWTSYDGDELTTWGVQGVTFPGIHGKMAFIAFNPSTTTPSIVDSDSFTPCEGQRYGANFGAALPDGMSSGTNDDFLISPKLLLPEDAPTMRFYVRAAVENYPETYEVMVSETDDNPNSFKVLKAATDVMYEDGWQEVNVDLSKYAGKEVHLAIHHISYDGFIFLVDDITVSKPAGLESIINIDDNAPVEYFNLQGIRVENPENGIYIRRQGTNVTKVYVK